jgi:restriction system protein
MAQNRPATRRIAQQQRSSTPGRRLAGYALIASAVVAGAEVVAGVFSSAWPAVPGAAVLVAGVSWGLRAVRSGREEERAETARLASLEQAGRYRSLEQLDAMSGTEFEKFIAGLCHRDGFIIHRAGGGAGDLGADVIAEAPDGRLAVLQCKRFKTDSPVSGPDMQRFLGTVRAVHNADVPVFVTTAWRFTRQARELAISQQVVLIDRDRLSHWVKGMSLEKYFPAPPV